MLREKRITLKMVGSLIRGFQKALIIGVDHGGMNLPLKFMCSHSMNMVLFPLGEVGEMILTVKHALNHFSNYINRN